MLDFFIGGGGQLWLVFAYTLSFTVGYLSARVLIELSIRGRSAIGRRFWIVLLLWFCWVPVPVEWSLLYYAH